MSFYKRASAFLFDAILLAVLAVGLALILSAVTGYDRRAAEMEKIYKDAEEKYGVSFDITEEEYRAMSDEERARYDEAAAALNADENTVQTYGIVVELTVLILSLSLFFAFMILEFALPLILGEGRTLGKKIFGICVCHADSVRVTPVALFVRSILGKYTIETMIPVLIAVMIYFRMLGIVGTVVIALICLLQVILTAVTKAHTPIHDLIAGTVTADYATQRIFESTDALVEYKRQLAAEEAARSEY